MFTARSRARSRSTDRGRRIDLLAHQLVVRAPPPILAEDVDPRLGRVRARALRKPPENRYGRMDDLMEDLELVGGLHDGDLRADAALAVDPDVYVPETQFSRAAARYLYRRIGRDAPAF